ncbi:hypothetical protein G6F40_016391 [Rhizopus arrhizus]|nr:hypothetical protein G6F40_016391 [Rhizopus arrhizus]
MDMLIAGSMSSRSDSPGCGGSCNGIEQTPSGNRGNQPIRRRAHESGIPIANSRRHLQPSSRYSFRAEDAGDFQASPCLQDAGLGPAGEASAATAPHDRHERLKCRPVHRAPSAPCACS